MCKLAVQSLEVRASKSVHAARDADSLRPPFSIPRITMRITSAYNLVAPMIRSLLVAAAVLASAADARKPVVHRSMPLSAEAAIQLADTCTQPNMRPPPSQRLFYSSAVEQTISSLVPKFKDPNLAQIFSNTLPNVLDTTVYSHVNRTGPGGVAAADTFIITGDIPAMWLRDSTNQVSQGLKQHTMLYFARTDSRISPPCRCGRFCGSLSKIQPSRTSLWA